MSGTQKYLKEHKKKQEEEQERARVLAAWFGRLRMVANSSTASNIEPWDIGAFLVALHEWAAGDSPSDGCHAGCGVNLIMRETNIDPKCAVRP